MFPRSSWFVLSALLLSAPVTALANVAPPPPELPVVGVEADPTHVIISGLVLSAAACVVGLVVTRWLPLKLVAPYVIVAVVGCVAATALCASWAYSKQREYKGNRGYGGQRRYPEPAPQPEPEPPVLDIGAGAPPPGEEPAIEQPTAPAEPGAAIESPSADGATPSDEGAPTP